MALTMTTQFWNSTIIQLKLLSKFKAWILLTSFGCLWHLIIWVYETRLLTARAAQKILYYTHVDSPFVKPKCWFSLAGLLYMHNHLGAETEHGILDSFAIKLQIFHSPNIPDCLTVKYGLSYNSNCKPLLKPNCPPQKKERKIQRKKQQEEIYRKSHWILVPMTLKNSPLAKDYVGKYPPRLTHCLILTHLWN